MPTGAGRMPTGFGGSAETLKRRDQQRVAINVTISERIEAACPGGLISFMRTTGASVATRASIATGACVATGEDRRVQRGSGRPLTPPGNGGGSLAKRSTSSITSERWRDESLTKARSNRRPSTVSLDGDPSCSLRSDINVRFFISRLYRVDQVESMPRNNPHGKINRTAKCVSS
jgi:hypothetical protein